MTTSELDINEYLLSRRANGLAEAKKVLSALKSYGVTHIHLYFDGCGDDGQVEQVKLIPDTIDLKTPLRAEHYALDGGVISHTQIAACHNGNFVVGETLIHSETELYIPTLGDLSETLGYLALEASRPGWEISDGEVDGAYGRIDVDLKMGHVCVDMNVRQISEREHTFDYSFGGSNG
jgi:hypothetical protein